MGQSWSLPQPSLQYELAVVVSLRVGSVRGDMVHERLASLGPPVKVACSTSARAKLVKLDT